MVKIVALDFELANKDYLSACALGIVVYEDGEIIFEKGYLIKPVQGFDVFIEEFINIHHIHPQDVENALSFDQIFERIHVHFQNAVLIAHNAEFDMGILRRLLAHYNIRPFTMQYACTVQLSRKLFVHLKNHRLNTVAEAMNVSLDHHQAHSDAKACMHIALYGLAKTRVESIENLCLITNVKLKKMLI